MKTLSTLLLRVVLSSALLILPCFQVLADDPTPQPLSVFSIPTTSGTNAQAVFFQTAGGQLYLVFASSTGNLFLWTLTPTTTPPQPDPVVDSNTFSVITVCQEQKDKLSDEEVSFFASRSILFYPYTVSMVTESNPPKNSLTYIGLSAGKSLPYTFLVNQDGKIFWQGPRPSSLIAWKAIFPFSSYTGQKPSTCPTGNCPFLRSSKP